MTPIGTIKIKTNGQVVEKTKTGWKKSNKLPEINNIVKLFKAHRNLKLLIDEKNKKFLKGQLSPNNQILGKRITQLPDGTKLDKAYSLFSTNLRIHDQDSHDHWDVLYQNKGGTYAYCYSLEKKQLHKKNKFKKVAKFNKVYNNLTKQVTKALKTDPLALPLHTLLKTYMRIGNETYYKAHGHKGLTTLMKKDIKIKNNTVLFNYLGKDGVPRHIEQKFSKTYINQLKNKLKLLKNNDFVFTNNGKPLHSIDFKHAFAKYCGQEFYPHIVRSHYATTYVQSFLKNKRRITKQEKDTLFLSVAAKLGHKKFMKKQNVWKDNFSVTVNHYIQPELVERVNKLVR
ncbi:hypothetical protein HOI26_01555 [Candidatus Woesearchaeota archaeon]|jgi:hypothetical protein|nr:hypothetical protein [Candidatus Woesearchaeota archaeon]MBT5739761.1 hypothetical protein [Candidatus Woesearchaeota archaeon]